MKRYYAALGMILTSMTTFTEPVKELTTMKDYTEICSQRKPVMILFYAPWCPACNALKEPYEKVAAAQSDVIMAKINVENDNLKAVTDAYNITAIPTIVTRQTGMLNEEHLNDIIQSHKSPQKKAPETPKAPVKKPLPQKTP